MSIIGLILSIYLTKRCIDEVEKLNEIKSKLRRVVYLTATNDEDEEQPNDKQKSWWMFFGR